MVHEEAFAKASAWRKKHLLSKKSALHMARSIISFRYEQDKGLLSRRFCDVTFPARGLGKNRFMERIGEFQNPLENIVVPKIWTTFDRFLG
jgi:hypothetical protein